MSESLLKIALHIGASSALLYAPSTHAHHHPLTIYVPSDHPSSILPSSSECPQCCWCPFTATVGLFYNLWCVLLSLFISTTFSLLWSQSQNLECGRPSPVHQAGLVANLLLLEGSKPHKRLKLSFLFQVWNASASTFSPTSTTFLITRRTVNPQYLKRVWKLLLKIPSQRWKWLVLLMWKRPVPTNMQIIFLLCNRLALTIFSATGSPSFQQLFVLT